MNHKKPISICIILLVFAIVGDFSHISAQESTNIRLSGGFKIISVTESAESSAGQKGVSQASASGEYPYTRPPLAGFTPLLAITTSDERSDNDFDFEHQLVSGYVGSPLNPPVNENFVIGIFDSGSVVNLVAEPFNTTLGITGSYLTGYTLEIGGAGSSVDAVVTQPLGIFMAGLDSVNSYGQLDPNYLVGHTNTSILVAPEISCGPGNSVSAMIGTPMISFYNTIIRVDSPVAVTVGSESYVSPDVQMLDQSIPLPTYSRMVSINFGGILPVTTSSYYAEFDPFEFEVDDPSYPTLLSFITISPPTGGNFYANIGAIEGEPGATNPLQNMRVLVDTGAQSSIITPGMAADLSLDLYNPDFTVEVCSVGGLVQDVPGVYIDYIKINAAGGALEFSHAPFIVLDIPSPDGEEFAGVLGMNFFWNRNVIFAPVLNGSGFLHLSEPVAFAYADFDGSGRVDLPDFATISAAWLARPGEPNWDSRCDLFIDEVIDMTDLAAFVDVWLNPQP